MSPDPLEIIWRCADTPEPLLAADEVCALAGTVFARLVRLGLLRQGETATNVTCDACTRQHVEEVFRVTYPDETTRFFIRCPEGGRVEVPRRRLLQWAVDYLPLLQALASSLSARGGLTEVVPGRVWNLGRAALAGRSRPVWVARGLAWPDAGRVAEALPKGRSPVLFFLGQPPDGDLLEIPCESVIELRTVVSLGEELSIDRDAIESQLGNIDAPPTGKTRARKHSARATTIASLKRELHQYIMSMKSRIRHADDAGQVFELPRLTQKMLAKMIGATESSVSRAIRHGNDLELKILLQTANDAEMIRRYSR